MDRRQFLTFGLIVSAAFAFPLARSRRPFGFKRDAVDLVLHAPKVLSEILPPFALATFVRRVRNQSQGRIHIQFSDETISHGPRSLTAAFGEPGGKIFLYSPHLRVGTLKTAKGPWNDETFGFDVIARQNYFLSKAGMKDWRNAYAAHGTFPFFFGGLAVRGAKKTVATILELAVQGADAQRLSLQDLEILTQAAEATGIQVTEYFMRPVLAPQLL